MTASWGHKGVLIKAGDGNSEMLEKPAHSSRACLEARKEGSCAQTQNVAAFITAGLGC